MTGRTTRRTARALTAATAITALVAPAAAASETAGTASGGGLPGLEALAKPFGDHGFPSWSRAVAKARGGPVGPAAEAARILAERVPAPRVERPTDGSPSPSAVAADTKAEAKPVTAKAKPAKARARARQRDAVWWADGHAGGRPMALALAAMGFDYGTTVDRVDIVRAGHDLGIAFGPRIDGPEIERVRLGAWRYGGRWMAASGLDFVGLLDPHDIALRAKELGVGIGSQVDPGDITAVIAAGQKRLSKQLHAGGFPHGQVVNTSDLRAAARIHGVRLGRSLRPIDARRIARTVAKKGDPNRTLQYAKIGRVSFHLPGRRPAYIGFHQPSNRRALPMRRMGLPLGEFMSSRGRSSHPAGAVDIPMPPGDRVYAPVSGRVVEARSYRLYGRYTDQRLRIVPDDDRRMLTTVLHVRGLRVGVGDRIVAGKTVIANSARKFPFWSQVDGYSGRNWGHVHIETRWR